MDSVQIFQSFNRKFSQLKRCDLIIYGTGEYGSMFADRQYYPHIVGFLDGKKNSGEFCGYPVLNISNIDEAKFDAIIIAASLKNEVLIFDRIRKTIKRCINIYGVHCGKIDETVGDMVDCSIYSSKINGFIKKYDTLTLKWQDLLVSSKFISQGDYFRFLSLRANENGINIQGFPFVRYKAEYFVKGKLGKLYLGDIYAEIQKNTGASYEKVNFMEKLECITFCNAWLSDKIVVNVVKVAYGNGVKINILNNSYYSNHVICSMLHDSCGLDKETINILPYNRVGKVDPKNNIKKRKNIYFCTDVDSNIIMRRIEGYDVLNLQGYKNMPNGHCGLDIVRTSCSVNTRTMINLAYSNSHKSFDDKRDRKAEITDIYQLAYRYVAPIVTTFVIWLINHLQQSECNKVLFASRDGFLIKELYDYSMCDIDKGIHDSVYFYTSRNAAIKSGIKNMDDIEIATLIFGNKYEVMVQRLFSDQFNKDRVVSVDALFKLSKVERNNYIKYLCNLNIKPEKEKLAFVDLMSSGTSQYFLERMLGHRLEGYYMNYYLSSVPYISVKSLYKSIPIDEYFSTNVRNMFESILTSFEPSIVGFDQKGDAVFSDNKPTVNKLNYISRAQDAIRDFYHDYWKNVYCKKEKIDEMAPVSWINMLKEENLSDKLFEHAGFIDDLRQQEMKLFTRDGQTQT